MRPTQREFNEKIVVVLSATANIVWGLAKIRIWEMSEDPNLVGIVKTLEKSCDHLRDSLKDLGVSTENFDAFDVRMAASKYPDN